MSFDFGTIIAVAAVLLFYLRLIIIQREKVKRNNAARANVSKEGNAKQNNPQFAGWSLVKNWYLIAAGMIILAIGAAFAGGLFGSAVRTWWWLPVTLGILLMGLGLG